MQIAENAMSFLYRGYIFILPTVVGPRTCTIPPTIHHHVILHHRYIFVTAQPRAVDTCLLNYWQHQADCPARQGYCTVAMRARLAGLIGLRGRLLSKQGLCVEVRICMCDQIPR
jgi:hypothetical protein